MENERYERIMNALEQLIKQGEKSLYSKPELYHSSVDDSQDDVNSQVPWKLNTDGRNQKRLKTVILSPNEMTKARASYLLNDRKQNNEPFLRHNSEVGIVLRNSHNNEPQKRIFSSNNNSNNSWWRVIKINMTTSTIGIVFVTAVISAHSVYSYSKENVVLILLFLFINRKRGTDTIMISLMDRASRCLLHKSSLKDYILLPHYINLTFRIISLCFLQ